MATTTARAQSKNTSLACNALTGAGPWASLGTDGAQPARNRARGASTASNAANGRARMHSTNLCENTKRQFRLHSKNISPVNKRQVIEFFLKLNYLTENFIKEQTQETHDAYCEPESLSLDCLLRLHKKDVGEIVIELAPSSGQWPI